jgi:DnaJ family protein C protein 28
MESAHQRKRQQLQQIGEKRENHFLENEPGEDRPPAGPLPSQSGPVDPKAKELARLRLVEQKIQQAMAEGAFDNLPGAGKPLDLQKNPYLDPSLELAYGLLKNNQLAPEWIERDKEIRREVEQTRRQLGRAWALFQAEPDQTAGWEAAVSRFAEQLVKLNRKIDDFNLIVPFLAGHRPRLSLAAELERLQSGEGEP